MKTSMAVLVLFFMFSCGDERMNFEGAAMMSPPPLSLQQAPVSNDESDRRLIKKGYLNVSVEKVTDTKSEIEKLCAEYRAYVVSEQQDNYADRLEYNQIIRIPATNFDVFVTKTELLGVEIKHKNIETSDVTEEFIDNEARLKTKKELENRYREILKQANDVKDILAVEAQLNQVRADIESMEGRLHYLRNQADLSTLTLVFFQPIGADFGFASKTIAAFINGWDNLLEFTIGLLNFWPFILFSAGIFYFAYRTVRFRKAKPAAPPVT
jgi:hypothetical protein